MSILDRLFQKYEEIADMSGFYARLSHNKWLESLTYAATGLTLMAFTVVLAALLKTFGFLTAPISAASVLLLSLISVMAIARAWINGIEAKELEQQSIDEFLEENPEQHEVFETVSGTRNLKKRLKGDPWVYAPVAITATYIVLELIW